MAKSKKARRDEPEVKYFMLVRKGLVQRWTTAIDGQESKVWPMAKSIDDAKRLAKYLKAAPDVRAAEIGAVQNETLEGHITLAIEEGCSAACCVMGWNADGSPIWGWINFD